MPQVTSFDVSGCDLRFHSHDHGPAHFHASVSGEWEIRVYFLHEPPTYDEKWVMTRIPASELREILGKAAEHRAALLEEWSEKVAADG
ncbi:MAG: DUF4160 domain-containing protein [Candidatus Palauibacterales bacterium]|nr:DUF4160 domain-containing protein [Candidatus Palauibacterales bacterium]